MNSKILGRLCERSILATLVFALSFNIFVFSGFTGILRAEAATGVPTIVAYQGRLTDSSGTLLGSTTGTTYYFKFSVWDNSNVGSGSKLWPVGAPGVASSSVTSGVFNVNIGDTANGFPDALDYNFQDNQNVYLQVEVSADGTTFETLAPRQRLTSSGFAINSGTVLGFTPSQTPNGSNIPVLNSGNLLLAGTNPQLNATSTNTLTLQGGTGTGNIQFFNASNTLSSAGNLTIAGILNIPSASTTIGGVAYHWPNSDGFSGYVLTTDGTGGLTWTAATGGGGGGDSNWLLAGSSLVTTSTVTKVGVGTTNPSSTLHVVGTAIITGQTTLASASSTDFAVSSSFTSNGTTALQGVTFANATSTGNLQVVTVTVTGASTLNNVSSTALTVSGASVLNTVSANAITASTSTLGNVSSTNVTASGSLSGGSLTVSGTSNLGNVSSTALSVSGATALSTLTATNASTTNITASGFINGGSLVITGATVVANVSSTNITASGFANVGTLTVSAISTLATTTITGLTVSGTSTLADTSVTGRLAINVTGSTQCLRVDANGVVTGTGTDCGSTNGGLIAVNNLSDLTSTSSARTNIGFTGGNKITISATGSIGLTSSAISQFTNDSGYLTSLSGALLSTNNLSDLTNTSTARTNLGLGTVATQNTSFFLQTANNLSDLVNTSTARTNIGLGSVANALQLVAANNLSDLVSTSSARTNIGLGNVLNASQLVAANNLSDLTNTSTARTNLGLGSAATLASTTWLIVANNLSDLTNTSTARTNLGLGTAATQSTSFFLQTANNLSDLTSTSSARTNIGLGSVANALQLVAANNLSDLTSTSSARTNIGLGSVANALQLVAANNLSDLISTSSARTNLGLGSAATANSTSFLQVANNLSDLASTSSARTNIGFSGGNKITISGGGAIGLTSDNISQFTNDSGYITSLSGALLSTNNLSDLTNTSTARTNIGLGNLSNALQLVAANNLADLTNTSTARTNIGLGSVANALQLIASSNLSDLASTTVARTNLGLSSAATANATSFLQVANNLSDLTNTSTARTNLGLGTAAIQNTGFFLQVSNNLSDLTSTSTARTNIGFSGGNKITISGAGAIGLTSDNISQFTNDSGYITSLSGALLSTNNLSDLTNTSTARTNLGLGSAATLASTTWLIVANNLSDLTNTSTARINIGLGSVANALQLVATNNLNDLTSTSSARTNIGLGNLSNALQLVAANNLNDLTNTSTARTNIGLGSVANALQLVAANNLSDLVSTSSARTNIGLGNVLNASQLVAASNLSDLTSTSSARTNLGLGTAAVQNTSFFLQTANNLSDLASTSSARTNIGLGSVANALQLTAANNLNDLTNTSTARTNIGLGNLSNALQLVASNNLSDLTSTSSARTNIGFSGGNKITISGAGAIGLTSDNISQFTNDSGYITSLSGALLSANNLSDLTSTSTARTNIGLGNLSNALQLVAANNLSDLTSTSSARSNIGLGNVANALQLIAANNFSDLTNTSTARTNLGLGSAATFASTTWLIVANNLSDLTNTSTARTNIGLGSVANALQLVATNNLNDLTNTSTARTNIGLGSVSNALQLVAANNLSDLTSTSSARTNIGFSGGNKITISGAGAIGLTSDAISQFTNDSGYLTSLSGALLISNNLSDLTNTSTARTNLGLGSAAIQNSSFFLQVANNLSDLVNTSTARTNIGLGSVANALQLVAANNLSDLINTSTARTNIGLGNLTNALQLVASNNLSDLTNTSTARTNIGFSGGNKITISATGSIGLTSSAISQFTNDSGYLTSLSGALLTANNLSDLTNTSTARTNLGLGSAATQNSTVFLQVANNLSDLANTSTARTNIGLGSVSNALQLVAANNLSDLTNTSTARTNIGLGSVSNALQLIAANNLNDLVSTSSARINLGVAIGTNVQAWDTDLDTFAALTKTKGNLIAADGSAWNALAVGVNGKCLVASSTATNGVSWEACSTGSGITSINGVIAADQFLQSTNDTNLTLTISSSSPNHTFALGWTGILSIARGGTATSTLGATGTLAYSDGSSYAFTAAGSSNQILTSSGGSTPTFQNIASLLTAGSNIVLSGTTNATIAVTSTPSFSALTVSGQSSFANVSSTNLQVSGTATLATTTATGLTVSTNGLTLSSSTPATTTQTLYALGSTLYFNGSAVGGGSPSLQNSYNGAATIETAANTPVLITETTAAANTGDLMQLTANPATGGTYTGDALQITMDADDANANSGNGLHIIVDQSQNTGYPILAEDDAGVDLFSVSETGVLTVGSAANGRSDINLYGDLVSKGYTIQRSLANIIDMAIYDTTRDSDGGAWRRNGLATGFSWYSETKDDGPSDPCVIASDDRCGSSEFPRKAILATTVDGMYIFDAKDNSLWMKFTQAGTYALGADANNNPSGIAALNGVVYVGTNGSAATGLYAIDFARDKMFRYNASNRTRGDTNIAGRNTATSYGADADANLAIADVVVNDVSVAMQLGPMDNMNNTPTLPLDSGVGPIRGVTLIGVANDTALSVIHTDTQEVMSYSETAGDDYNAVYMSTRGRMYALNETQGQFEVWRNVNTDTASELAGNPDRFFDQAQSPITLGGVAPTFGTSSLSQLAVIERASLAKEPAAAGTLDSGDVILVGTNLGLAEVHDSGGNLASAAWTKITTNATATPLMPSGARAAFLFDEPAGSTDANSDVPTVNVLQSFGSPTFGQQGVRGTDIDLNGTSQFLGSDANNDGTIDNDTDYNMGTIGFTISVWLKHDVGNSGIDTVFEKCWTPATPTAGTGCAWGGMNASGQYLMGIDDDATWTVGSSMDDITTASGPSFADGQWHHVVFTNTDTDICVYVDGKQSGTCDTTLAATATMEGSANALTIGASCSGANCATGANFYAGEIDDLVYSANTGTTASGVNQIGAMNLYLDGRAHLLQKRISVVNADVFSATTIGDTAEVWSKDEFVGRLVEITGGTGTGEVRRIISNTTTTLTVVSAFGTTPDATSDFRIDGEHLYGASSDVKAVAVDQLQPFGRQRRTYVGTSNGSDGGGVSVLDNVGVGGILTEVYSSESGLASDDFGTAWSGTDSDDMKAIAAHSGTLVLGSLAAIRSIQEEVNLAQNQTQMMGAINGIQQELVSHMLFGSTQSTLGIGNGADLAERYSSTDQLEAGEVVASDSKNALGVKRSTGAYQKNVIGVVATRPAIVIGPQTDTSFPVALVGRVPVKVTTENGLIKNGDRIASASLAGYGMRATKAGRVLGAAIEDLDPEQLNLCPGDLETATRRCGTVTVFVNLVDYAGTSISVLMREKTGAALAPTAGSLENETANTEMVMCTTEGQECAPDTAVSLEVDQVAQQIAAVVDIERDVLDFLTEYKATLDQASPLGSEIFTDRLSAALEIFAPRIVTEGLRVNTIGALKDAITFSSDMVFFGRPYFNADSGGFAVIKGGARSVDVLFEKEYIEQPIVTASITLESEGDEETIFADSVTYLIAKKSVKGFTIMLNKNTSRDLKFSWTAAAVKGVKTFTSRLPDVQPALTPETVEVPPPIVDPQPSASTTEEIKESVVESQPAAEPVAGPSIESEPVADPKPTEEVAPSEQAADPDALPAQTLEASTVSSELAAEPAPEIIEAPVTESFGDQQVLSPEPVQ